MQPFPRGKEAPKPPTKSDDKGSEPSRKRSIQTEEANPKSKKPKTNQKTNRKSRHSDISRISSISSISDISDISDHINLRLPDDALVLTRRSTTSGMVLLGTVSAIRTVEIEISLPFNQKGHLSISEISDVLHDILTKEEIDESKVPDLGNLYCVGQWISVYVISNTPRIELSTRESLFNRGLQPEHFQEGKTVVGSIKSIEDYGYMVGLGLPEVSAFLPKSNVHNWEIHRFLNKESSMDLKKKGGDKKKKEESDGGNEEGDGDNEEGDGNNEEGDENNEEGDENNEEGDGNNEEGDENNEEGDGNNEEGEEKEVEGDKTLQIGQNMEFIITSLNRDNERCMLTLSTDLSQVWKSKYFKFYDFTSIKPGMLVDATVSHHLPNGIFVKFGKVYGGTVSMWHFGELINPEKIPEVYPKKRKLVARILFVDLDQRMVGLTIHPQAIKHLPQTPPVKSGTFFENVEIVKVHKNTGLSVSLPNLNGFVHISSLSDGAVKLNDYSVNSKLRRTRVIGFSVIDQLVNLTAKESDFKFSFLGTDDAEIGALVKCTVTKILNNGLLVSLNPYLIAFVPIIHTADVVTPNLQTRFNLKDELSGRILSFQKSGLLVTLKHSLVEFPPEFKKSNPESKVFPFIRTYDDCQPGRVSRGVVVSVRKMSCTVSFYGNVKGKLHISEIPGKIMDLRQTFKIGQIVKCRVRSFNPKNMQLELSNYLNEQSITPEEMENLNKFSEEIVEGKVVSAVVVRALPNLLKMNIIPPGTTIPENGRFETIPNGISATLPNGFLSDFFELVPSLKNFFTAGKVIHNLVVTRIINTNQKRSFVLCRKYSIFTERENIPKNITEAAKLVAHTTLGTVSKIDDKLGVYVQFFGALNALAHPNQLSLPKGEKFTKSFKVHQTVYVHIERVDVESKHIFINFKKADSSRSDKIGFSIQSFLDDMDLVNLKGVKTLPWGDKLSRSSLINVAAQEITPIGVIFNLPDFPVLNAFSTCEHIPPSLQESGETPIQSSQTFIAKILDFDKQKKILDVSLSPHLVKPFSLPPSKLKAIIVGKYLLARVELAKKNYLIFSLEPEWVLPEEVKKYQKVESVDIPRILGVTRTCQYNNALFKKSFSKPISSYIWVQVKSIPQNRSELIIGTFQRKATDAELRDLLGTGSMKPK